MSITKLVKWGNSLGIRIPAQDLKIAHAYTGEEFKLTVNAQGGFTLIPIKNPQEKWLEAFNAIADSNSENLLIDHIENEFDKDEWTW